MSKAKTRQEVATEYGICTKTLRRWLKKSNITLPSRDLISPKMIQEIYNRFGCPIMSDGDPLMSNNSLG